MRYAHPNGDCLNIEKHEKDEKNLLMFVTPTESLC